MEELVKDYMEARNLLTLLSKDNSTNNDMIAIELLKIKRNESYLDLENEIQPNEDFVRVDKEFIKSDSLSWTAKGLYLYMVGLPEGTPLTNDQLSDAIGNKNSYAEVFDAMIELEKLGLIN